MNILNRIVIFLLLFGSLLHSQDYNIYLKANSELSGEQVFSYNGTNTSSTVMTGFSFAAEIVNNYSENIKFGIGTNFQFPRSEDIEGANKFFFIPIYGSVHLNVYGSEMINTNIVTKIGYSFFNGDSKMEKEFGLHGGINLGAGVNVIFNNFIIAELMYQENNGNAVIRNAGTHEVAKIKYSYVSAGVGIVFDF